MGRCEAQGGAPRPPPQPTGPRGPLGPCPARLAPWVAVQAPKPHPIRPQAWAAAMVSSGCRAWPSGGVLRHTHATKLAWVYTSALRAEAAGLVLSQMRGGVLRPGPVGWVWGRSKAN